MKEARHESGICMPFISGSRTGKTIVKNFRKVIDFGDENWEENKGIFRGDGKDLYLPC